MEIEIKPTRLLYYNFKELYEFRDTLFFLTWKDIKIKYKQAFLGFLWVILQPTLMMIIFLVLQKVINIPTVDNQVPYSLFVLSGILLWNLFSTSVIQSANSVVTNSHIIKKIYFPRIFFPLSSTLVSLFDFFIGMIVYIPIMFYYGNFPNVQILWILPVCILFTTMISLGIGSFFSALNVKYRDVKYIIPFIVQLLFFVSPIFYSHLFLSDLWFKTLYYVNPMTGILELLRYGLFQTEIYYNGLWISFIVTIVIFFIGMIFFRRIETTFADLA